MQCAVVITPYEVNNSNVGPFDFGVLMNLSSSVGSIEWFIEVIRQLPSDEPVSLGTAGYNRYTTQKAHWLGWLDPAAGTGTYPRSIAPGRDARYVYNHIIEPKLLIWLTEAAGVDAQLVLQAKQAADSANSMPGKSAAIRKLIPWELVCDALVSSWRTKKT